MLPKVVILQFHPAPYRDPIFEEIHRRSLVDIRVLSMAEVDYGHMYRLKSKLKYPNRFLGEKISLKYLGYVHSNIFKELFHNHYDVYVTHMGTITGMIITLYAIKERKPIILTLDSVSIPSFQQSFFHKLRRWSLKHMLKHIAAAWVPGNASQEYLESLAFPKERIFQGAYCLDLDQILKLSEAGKANRQVLREQLGIQADDWLFLFVGRMFPFRGVKYLLRAFYHLRQTCNKVKLLLIGDGPEKADLENLSQRLGIRDIIIFLDPVLTDKLTYYYMSADAYVTAALQENYSLALAQAAICGLPMISPDSVGAAKDYLVEGETGFIVPKGDHQALANAMMRLVLNRDNAIVMGQKATSLAKSRTTTWAATQFESSVFYALDLYNSNQ